MQLVIVESPTKAKKLAKYLGSDFKIEASVGHIRDLPKSGMGIDTDNDFEPTYEINEDKKAVVDKLKKLAKQADTIILATDPDREGEAIAWHLQHIITEQQNGKSAGKNGLTPTHRATFNEITKEAVLKAIENPKKVNLDLVDAQQARRVVDRLVGYKLSPVLWKKIRRGLSAGRVQSVALRLIVEREREIEAFVPEEYWEIDVVLDSVIPTKETVRRAGDTHLVLQDGQDTNADSADEKNAETNSDDSNQVKANETSITQANISTQTRAESVFLSRVIKANSKDFKPQSTADVKPVVADLIAKSTVYVVSSVEKKERKRVSLPPFTTSTLQQSAATRLGMTSKQTMRVAQQLYEEGLITYHRTDSVALSQQAVTMAREHIAKAFGHEYLPEKPRFFSVKSKNAQEAHESIRATAIRANVQAILQESSRFTQQHVRLYDLIQRRYVASQMEIALYDQTTILVDAQAQKNTYVLKTTGSVLRFDGWMKLFPAGGDSLLPEVKEGRSLDYIDVTAAQKFTQPPPRYNDASLVKELEKRGIGRPSTYASIISVIEDRGYVERDAKRFVATAIGMTVCDFLVEHFKTVMDYDFTAEMEEDLDRISRGEKKWKNVVRSFWGPFIKIVDGVQETAGRAQIPVEKTGEKCPVCADGEIVIRTGRFGKFKSCSLFPECKFTQNIVETVDGVVCPLCQKGDVVAKKSRWGKPFFGCSLYPKCGWASWKKPEPGEIITQEEWEVQQAEREDRKKKRKASLAVKGGQAVKGGPAKTAASKSKTTKAKAKTATKAASKTAAKTTKKTAKKASSK
jgi:DNA topoisomerase-1